MVGSLRVCCAGAVSGHAAAPPSSAMNSRLAIVRCGNPEPRDLARGSLYFRSTPKTGRKFNADIPPARLFRPYEGDDTPRWRIRSRSPEGTEYVEVGIFHEIVEAERLVFTHVWEDQQGKPGHRLQPADQQELLQTQRLCRSQPLPPTRKPVPLPPSEAR
jgi:hypothetical protein